MDWMEQFIDEILREVPKSGYRRRTEKELRDHMRTEYEVLLGGGRTPEEARAEALRTMGDPERLRGEYEAVWRRDPLAWAERAAYRTAVIAAGCVLMGTAYIATAFMLTVFGFTYDAYNAVGPSFPILAGGITLAVFSVVLFSVPFGLGTVFLRRCFRKENHPRALVTAGLLAAWAGEKAAIIWISMKAYAMPLCTELLVRIYHGGDTTAPWMSPVYYLATFAACLLLGQLFGRRSAGENRIQTA